MILHIILQSSDNQLWPAFIITSFVILVLPLMTFLLQHPAVGPSSAVSAIAE